MDVEYINDREIERFLKIFILIIEGGRGGEAVTNQKEVGDSQDNATDIILMVASKISQLLEGDIDIDNLPKIISKSLKTLKAIVGLFKLKDAKNKSDAKGKKAT